MMNVEKLRKMVGVVLPGATMVDFSGLRNYRITTNSCVTEKYEPTVSFEGM
ncbi:hypothetical protein HanRHA438_Chr12g0539811 [Helianthus annuus]|nr:hypothetical protein HanRHA438_Chr12g0539811 [Helianthus annuus]